MKQVVAYLEYLRDASRRIAIGNQLEKCLLPPRGKKKAVQIVACDRVIKASDYQSETFYQVRKIALELEKPKYHDLQLFCGIGMVCGKLKNRQGSIAGPLVLYPCEISSEEDGSHFIQYDKPMLNLDLFASVDRLLGKIGDDDDIYEDEQSVIGKEAEVIASLHSIIESYSSPKIELFSDVIGMLRDKVDAFQAIPASIEPIDYIEEFKLYRSRKPSLFDRPLQVMQNVFYFASRIPDMLSAFEALDSLIDKIHAGGVRNRMLQDFIGNVLADKQMHLTVEDKLKEDDVSRAVEAVPFLLSRSQRNAIRQAWDNPVSYIQGPPGTGKSFTIAALVLTAIKLEKRVLVISQKEPALDVVVEKVNKVASDTAVRYVKANRDQLKAKVKELRLRYGGMFAPASNEQYTQKVERLDELEEKLQKFAKKIRIHASRSFEYRSRMQDFIGKRRIAEAFLPEGHPIRPVEDIRVYDHLLDTLSKYVSESVSSKATHLFVKRVKQHFKQFFLLDPELLPDFIIDSHVDELLQACHAYYNVLKAEERIPKSKSDDLHQRLKMARKSFHQACSELIASELNIRRVINFDDQKLQKFENFFHWKRADYIHERMQNLDYDTLLEFFPVWVSEIRHLGHLFPIQPDLFDIVVVDEASQVNLAEIVPAFYRGKRICIVGDHKQLSIASTGLNFSMSSKLDQLLWQKYENQVGINYDTAKERDLLVSRSSILNFIRSEHYSPKPPESLLNEHFRSMPSLAQYTNGEFYGGDLHVMTETADRVFQEAFHSIAVDGRRNSDKVVNEEVEAVRQVVFMLISRKLEQQDFFEGNQHHVKFQHVPAQPTIGIISPMRNQVRAIAEDLEMQLDDEDWSKYDLKVGTPEEFQGHERDVMIISLSIDPDHTRSQGFYSDDGRWNVMTSRAIHATYIVYSGLPANFKRPYRYFKHFGVTPKQLDIEQNISIEKTPIWKMNPDLLESDFEYMVYGFLQGVVSKLNDSGARLEIFNQVTTCGQKRLDFVLYNQLNKKAVALEVDGQYHFMDGGSPSATEYTSEHKERIEILERAGWGVINTPFYCWYDGGWLASDSATLLEEQQRLSEKIAESLLLRA